MSATTEPPTGSVPTLSGTSSPPPSRRLRLLVTALAFALAAAGIAFGTMSIRASAESAPRPPAAAVPIVETLTLERLDAREVRRAYAARVEPAREARLSFETGGTLVEVLVDEGERVAAGTVLARLDTRLLEAKRTQLAAARAALDSDAELAELALARQRKLEDRGFAADEALDEARLANARVRSGIAEADAALALVDVELDKAVLRAPFDVLVGERALDPGATVGAGTPVLTVMDAAAPRLRVGLPPERAAALGAGETYRFVAGTREVPARLVTRRGDVDPRTRTVSALFEPLDGAGEGLFFGELLELSLVERVSGPVFDVPLAALAEDERGLWSVMQVVEAGVGAGVGEGAGDGDGETRLRRVAVEIVDVGGERAYVAASLDDASRIVADGRHRVVDGERVRVAAPGSGVDVPADVTADGERGA